MRLIRIFLLLMACIAIKPLADLLFNVHMIQTDAMTSISNTCLFAQNHQQTGSTTQSQKGEPAETSVDLYKVMGVILVIWIGLALFLFRLDRKIARLEKNLKKIK